jgi:triosephosphate isomerase
MARKFLIAGNWKMNKTPAEGVALAREIIAEAGVQNDVVVLVCPPFTALAAVGGALGSSQVQLGAQNLHPEPNGAFTGEISASMLRELHCSHVIIGHSERREYFGESDAFINRKVQTSLEHKLKPILCVGETLSQREAGQTSSVVTTQLQGGLAGVKLESGDQLVIAYEPVWAIGTGKTATPEMAQEVHALIRSLLVTQFGEAAGVKIKILYGGSMKPNNAAELMAQPDIDGGLIGGASLVGRDFLKIIQAAQERAKA